MTEQTDDDTEKPDNPHANKHGGSKPPTSGAAADLWHLTDEEVAEIFDEEEP